MAEGLFTVLIIVSPSLDAELVEVGTSYAISRFPNVSRFVEQNGTSTMTLIQQLYNLYPNQPPLGQERILIISEYNLNDMSFYDFLQSIQQIQCPAYIHVAVVDTDYDITKQFLCHQRGAVYYLKPFDSIQMEFFVNEALRIEDAQRREALRIEEAQRREALRIEEAQRREALRIEEAQRPEALRIEEAQRPEVLLMDLKIHVLIVTRSQNSIIPELWKQMKEQCTSLHTTSSGRAALRVLTRWRDEITALQGGDENKDIYVLFSELDIPGNTGLAWLEKVKRDAIIKKAYVVLFTYLNDTWVVEGFKEKGVFHITPLPLTVSKFTDTIKQIIFDHQSRKNLEMKHAQAGGPKQEEKMQ